MTRGDYNFSIEYSRLRGEWLIMARLLGLLDFIGGIKLPNFELYIIRYTPWNQMEIREGNNVS